MSNMFNFSDSSFKNFSKFYDEAPQKARRVTARMLNQFAFGTKTKAAIQIKTTMNVRNFRFVKSKLRVKMTKSVMIDKQKSITFSTGGGNFTGWKEQVKGSQDPRGRTQTLLARSGNFKKKVKGSARMKPDKNFISESDFKLPSKNKMPAYLARVKRKHKNKPFIIKKQYKRLKRGLYIYKRKQLKMLQNFDPAPKKIRKNPWMQTARKRYFDSNNLQTQWAIALRKTLTRRKF